MDTKKIGKFIAKLRNEKSMTQEQLGEVLYVTREAVSKWERGINTPEVQTLILMGEYFNVSVNELLAGERVNKENKDAIDNIALSILTFTKSKINRIKILAVTIIIILIILFFIFYFIYNYNSLRVYLVWTDHSQFELTQSLIVTSKQKSYISLGNLINRTDEEIESIELYYEFENVRKSLLITDDITTLNIDLNSYNQFVKVESIDKILSHLYINLITESMTIRIPLKSELDYSNKYILAFLFSKDKPSINHSLLPKVVREKFIYKNEKYEFEYSANGKDYSCLYDGLRNIVITENKMIDYVYELNYNRISLYNDFKTIFKYSFNTHKCIENNCKKYKDVIKSFEENVLN